MLATYPQDVAQRGRDATADLRSQTTLEEALYGSEASTFRPTRLWKGKKFRKAEESARITDPKLGQPSLQSFSPARESGI